MGTQNEHQRKVEVSQIMECSRSQAPLEPAKTASFTSGSPQITTDKNKERKRGGLGFE